MQFKDYYEILGCDPRRRARGDQARLPQAGPQISSGRQQGKERRRQIQGCSRGVRGVERSRQARGLRSTGPRLPQRASSFARRPIGNSDLASPGASAFRTSMGSAIFSPACSAAAGRRRGPAAAQGTERRHARPTPGSSTSASRRRTRAPNAASRFSETGARDRWTCKFRPASRTARRCESRAAAAPVADLSRQTASASISTCCRARMCRSNCPWRPGRRPSGAKVAVPTLGGTVELTVPAGAQSGQKLRLRGRGLPGNPAGISWSCIKLVTPAAKPRRRKKPTNA